MEVQGRLADVLWYVALLCGETGVAMQDIAAHSIVQLQARTKDLDPERR
jgi:NTP pyrophosphatase (non-canonical NTP hydrolase)